MRTLIEIENIGEMRRVAGIDDIELREQILHLRVGDAVKLTFMANEGLPAAETILVRITSIRTTGFRGKLTDGPALPRLPGLHVGSPVVFTRDHIHSVAKLRARPPQ